MPRAIGIMGGTFDPIHYGHLLCAENAMAALGLGEVFFVVAGNPSFKRDKELASAHDRLEMCRIACAANDSFSVSSAEIERKGITFTIDTIEEFEKSCEDDAQIWFIIGSDAFLTVPKWHDADKLIAKTNFGVIMRPGDDRHAVDSIIEDANIKAELIDCPLLDISSSYIRNAVENGHPIRYLTPDAVCAYIAEKGLYSADGGAIRLEDDALHESAQDPLSKEFFDARKADLEKRVSPKRMKHIEGVSETARLLAETYGEDIEKAALAGLLHDWDKAYDDDGIRERVRSLGMEEEVGEFLYEKMPQVLHGPTAAVALSREYPRIPQDVIEAIYNHTTSSTNPSNLEKIIYIADAIEPSRNFESIDYLRSCIGEMDLDELFFQVYKFWTMALIKYDKVVHPMTMTIWNSIVEKRPKKKDAHKGSKKKKG